MHAVLPGRGFSMRVEPGRGFVRAYVYGGRDSLDVSIAMWRMLAEQCMRLDAKRLLVVEDLEDEVPAEEHERLIEAIAGLGMGHVRVAFVELRQDGGANENCGILALEQGLTVHVFSDENTARHWLLYGGDTD